MPKDEVLETWFSICSSLHEILDEANQTADKIIGVPEDDKSVSAEPGSMAERLGDELDSLRYKATRLAAQLNCIAARF